MRKLSKIDESMWGDVMDRSAGREKRNENKLDSDNQKALDSYIKLFINRLSDKTGFKNTLKDFLWYIDHNKYVVKDLYKVTPDVPLLQRYVEKEWENLEAIIQTGVEEKNKKMNESMWGGVMDRSAGRTIRPENQIGNIKSLKPIDMGGSVLWSDQNLIIDGEEIFTYDEANDLISNSKWRLPTLKEVAELYGHNIYYDSEYIYLDDVKKISFKKCGCGYPKDTIIDNGKCFYGWTSEPYIKNPKSINVFVIDHYTLDYTGIDPVSIPVTQDRNTKCCIRLVRNK